MLQRGLVKTAFRCGLAQNPDVFPITLGGRVAVAIFVNYRIADSESITGRIDDRLREHFGATEVYRDIVSITPGVDFAEHIRAALDRCDVCIVIIGKKWLTERLLDETDFVRLEIETVLERGIPIIPVLVEGASMPAPSALPATIKAITRRQFVEIDSKQDFHTHVGRLITAIEHFHSYRSERKGWDRTRPLPLIAASFGLVGAVATGVSWFARNTHSAPPTSAAAAPTISQARTTSDARQVVEVSVASPSADVDSIPMHGLDAGAGAPTANPMTRHPADTMKTTLTGKQPVQPHDKAPNSTTIPLTPAAQNVLIPNVPPVPATRTDFN